MAYDIKNMTEEQQLHDPVLMLAVAVLDPYQKQMKFDSSRGEFSVQHLKQNELNLVSRALVVLGADRQNITKENTMRITSKDQAISLASNLTSLGFKFTGQANVPSLSNAR